MAKKTDQKTLDLIKQVKDRKAEISRIMKPNWKTNCSFSFADGNLNNSTNLHVETNVKKLIDIAGFIIQKKEAYKLGCDAISLVGEFPAFKWNDFTAEEWIEDVRTRVNQVQIQSKKKSLEALEARLNAVISPELRAEMELEAISAELK